MDTQVILYSVQCYALHWTDNNGNNNDDADDAVLTSDADLGVVLNAAELWRCDARVLGRASNVRQL